MTSILFRWRDWGATKGKITVSPLAWSKEPETWVVPKPISLRVEGEAQVDLTPYRGRPAEFTLNPDGLAPSHTFVALIPTDGEVNSVDLVPVDRSTLEPLSGEEALTAAEILAQASASTSDARGYVVASREYAQEASSAASGASSSASEASSSAITARDASLASQRASQDSADHASRAAASAGLAASSAQGVEDDRLAAEKAAQLSLASRDSASASAEQASDAVALSQEAALSVMPMLSGSVTIAPEGGALAVDLGRAVNVATGLAGTSGAVDVTFPDVTTPDGRVNPDGLGTLLQVDAGADRLTWPGGTVVHGTPPAGQPALASLVRVGGAVTVVWPPDVVTSTAPGVTAQIAEIEQIIGGEVEVQPGGTVMQEAWPGIGAVPAVFVNPYSRPTNRELVLTVGKVEQVLFTGGELTVYTTHRPGGLKDYSLDATVDLGASGGGPLKDKDGWLIAVAPGPAFGNVYVAKALRDIQSRVGTSSLEIFTDGTWGVILQYDASNPRWEVSEWGGVAELVYFETGDTTGWDRYHGMVLVSGLALPMAAQESDYASLGITLPGTFHRAAELGDMGVYIG
mgnify:CR=1 FL=1